MSPPRLECWQKGLREHAYAVDVAGDGDDASFRRFARDAVEARIAGPAC